MADRWQALIDLALRDQGELVRHGPDAFEVSIQCGLASPSALVAAAPCELEERWAHEDYLVDQTGEEVHAELTHGLLTNDEERVIYSYQDHWQAGLFATLRRYATREEYDREVEAQLAEVNDAEERRF